MVAPQRIKELINHAVNELPYDKQVEIYDFVNYLKEKFKVTAGKKKKGALENLIGVIEGPKDLGSKHDEIYD